MGLRNWNDNKGWDRGARGIDTTKGDDYGQKFNNATSNRAQFARCWDFGNAGACKPSETNVATGGQAGESPDYDTL